MAVTRELPDSAAETWEVVGDFGREHVWASNLAECTRDTEDVRVGCRRNCTLTKPLMGRSEVSEELTAYDEDARALAYRLDGAAGLFRSADGSWQVEELPSGCRVTIGGRFEPRNAVAGAVFGPLAKRVAVRAAERAMDDLSAHLAAR